MACAAAAARKHFSVTLMQNLCFATMLQTHHLCKKKTQKYYIPTHNCTAMTWQCCDWLSMWQQCVKALEQINWLGTIISLEHKILISTHAAMLENCRNLVTTQSVISAEYMSQFCLNGCNAVTKLGMQCGLLLGLFNCA